MSDVKNVYQKTTEDGLVEVRELENGMSVEILLEPTETYLERMASQVPPPPDPGPSEIDILGQQLVDKDLQILGLQNDNQTLGQQLVDMDLRLLKGGL